MYRLVYCTLFFFNDTATTEIYTLSLHDALPISCGARPPRRTRHEATGAGPPRQRRWQRRRGGPGGGRGPTEGRDRVHRAKPQEGRGGEGQDRKSTRLKSSHGYNSYARFFFKKKKTNNDDT